MRALIIVLFNILSFCAIGQMSLDEQELDLLDKEKVLLEKEIKKIKLIYDSLNTNLKRVARQKKLLESRNNSFSIKATLKMNGYIYPEPNYDTEKIVKILKNQSVTLISYSPGYFLIDEPRGYLLAMAVINNKEIEAVIKTSEQQKIKERKELVRKRAQKEDSVAMNKYSSQYGKEIAMKIVRKQYWIGMSTDMAKYSLGTPKDINKTVGSWGIHEQWVYSMDFILYFENGKLKSYQK